MRKLTRRTALLGGGIALGGVATGAYVGRNPDPTGARALIPAGADGTLNDASGLMPTPVARHNLIRADHGQTLVQALRAELAAARADGRRVNIGAARHSMGGHAIPRGGYAVTLDNQGIEIDRDAKLYRVHAGARWAEVIAALEPQGLSPRVMQSNNDFGVAATFSVNAHGWPAPHGPMGATVRAFDMVLPSGEVLRASRDQNSEIFGHAMGGYGLIGLITALEVEAAENRLLEPSFERMHAGAFGTAMAAVMGDPALELAYGRMDVARASFFEEALLITYRPAADAGAPDPAPTSGPLTGISRGLFRSQVGRERMKSLRWWTETVLGPMAQSGAVSRNTLLNEPVLNLDDGDPSRTDVLHEYFIPPARFADFVAACRRVIPDSFQELLNVTLRFVRADPVSVLAYAPDDRIAAVMLFSQEMTARAEADHARMTHALIDRVLEIGGTYYLPYRPHASPAQFGRAYPRARDFADFKRRNDPDDLMGSVFWDNYLENA